MKAVILTIILFFSILPVLTGQILMENVQKRNFVSLNGQWDAIVDLYSRGEKMKLYLDSKPECNSYFYEYSYDNGLKLKVPGDWNSQLPELLNYESSVWYKTNFIAKKSDNKRNFIYFAGVNYMASVYLNGKLLGKHEGGFTPFQFEITDYINDGDNLLVVHVNNRRGKNTIPALVFDWWNYGGITRDVYLVETQANYIRDYFVKLSKGSDKMIDVSVQLDGRDIANREVTLSIPEIKITKKIRVNKKGYAEVTIPAEVQLWCPDNPKLYEVFISMNEETIVDEIGFRRIERVGNKILLNGKAVFLKGINVHEEIPQEMRRAYSKEDAAYLIAEVKNLGCNFLRLTHYVQNEYIVRLAEKNGIMIWEEIPIWQEIDFDDKTVFPKARVMLNEMISRDKNRCSIIFWSVANETKVTGSRNRFLKKLVKIIRKTDNTRLITASFDNVMFNESSKTFTLNDPLAKELDVISINKYLGWYMPWPSSPTEIKWSVSLDKPLLFSEFGGESMKGINGQKDVASSWSEDYQEQLYVKNLEMIDLIPNLCGVSPWVLFDFRSPYRMHQTLQNGWNRKGLLSDKGYKKKAWYVMKEYFDNKK